MTLASPPSKSAIPLCLFDYRWAQAGMLGSAWAIARMPVNPNDVRIGGLTRTVRDNAHTQTDDPGDDVDHAHEFCSAAPPLRR